MQTVGVNPVVPDELALGSQGIPFRETFVPLCKECEIEAVPVAETVPQNGSNRIAIMLPG
jgi:hypothetical protein